MASTTRVRMPKAMCKVPQDCELCTVGIKPGQRMGKDFTSNSWVHLGCLVRKINTKTQ